MDVCAVLDCNKDRTKFTTVYKFIYKDKYPYIGDRIHFITTTDATGKIDRMTVDFRNLVQKTSVIVDMEMDYVAYYLAEQIRKRLGQKGEGTGKNLSL